jgi:hypothetical protein
MALAWRGVQTLAALIPGGFSTGIEIPPKNILQLVMDRTDGGGTSDWGFRVFGSIDNVNFTDVAIRAREVTNGNNRVTMSIQPDWHYIRLEVFIVNGADSLSVTPTYELDGGIEDAP